MSTTGYGLEEQINDLNAELREARAQIAAKDAALLEDKPFGIDPATHFLHADDGGAPDSCIFYVPRDELAEARAQLANRGLALEAAEEECVELRAQIAAKDAALDALDEAHQITQQNLWQDITELRASLAGKEQEHQDFRLQNDAEWRAKLDHLKAQIAAKDAKIDEIWSAFGKIEDAMIEARKQIAEKDALLLECRSYVLNRPDPSNVARRVKLIRDIDIALTAPARETE